MLIALCDDNKTFLEDIHHKLMGFLPEETQYLSFESGDEFLKADIEPDYIFLDIEINHKQYSFNKIFIFKLFRNLKY